MQDFNERALPEEGNLMQNRKMRATWVSSVINLDWPSASSLTIRDEAERIKRQKEELTGILDDIVAMNMNTVVFQVVPCADALYASDLLPWSKYLTGTLGKIPASTPLPGRLNRLTPETLSFMLGSIRTASQ
nr:family 10 glycosylhydrolase [Pantoea ananatis]